MTEPGTRWRPPTFLRASAVVHAAAVGGVVLAPGHWRWALAAVTANQLVMVGAGLLPRTGILGPNLTRLPDSEARTGRVALTIDDGPDPEVTPRVLALLARRGVTASFFLIGRRAERHPQWVAEIIRCGHQVENHTYSHANSFSLWGQRRQARDIDRGQRVLTEIGGRPPRYFRPPAGIRGPFLEPLLHRRGLALASWTRRGFDAVDGRADRVAGRLIRGLAAGDILLLHDGNAARDAAREPVILDVLPRVLDVLEARGLRGVALPRPLRPSRALDELASDDAVARGPLA